MGELYIPRLKNNVITSWDSTGCYDWCETNGVDYIFDPDPGYTKQYFDSVGIDTTSSSIYNWVDSIWSSNNYFTHELDENKSLYLGMLRAKSFVIAQYNKNTLNTNYVFTWKDGIPYFVMADYINNSTSENCVLLDPIKAPDGIYYSSSYPFYTQYQKDVILQFESTVDSVGYDDTTALINALQDLDTQDEFLFRRIDVTYGGIVGEANDYIKIFYLVDGTLLDSYPIYKKGVR
jgi:hypothetical protein